MYAAPYWFAPWVELWQLAKVDAAADLCQTSRPGTACDNEHQLVEWCAAATKEKVLRLLACSPPQTNRTEVLAAPEPQCSLPDQCSSKPLFFCFFSRPPGFIADCRLLISLYK